MRSQSFERILDVISNFKSKVQIWFHILQEQVAMSTLNKNITIESCQLCTWEQNQILKKQKKDTAQENRLVITDLEPRFTFTSHQCMGLPHGEHTQFFPKGGLR